MGLHRCAGCGAFNRVENAEGRTPICGRCKQRLDVSGSPQAVDERQLAQALESSPVPVLVDFWAEWCGPCRMAAPILAEIARARAGKLLVLKLNTDANPRAAQRHGVQGIPLFVLFQDGRERARQTGALPKPAFDQWLTRALQ